MMNFDRTEEQGMVAEAARNFAEQFVLGNVKEWDETQYFPAEILREAGKMGFMGILVPEAYGGSALGYHEYIAIVEEISKVDPSIGLSIAAHNSLCTNHILSFGNENQKQRYLPKLASGEFIGAWGLTEHNTGSDAGGMNTTAVKDGDHWILNGSKNFITHGKSGDITVVIVRTGEKGDYHGMTAFILEKGMPGFTSGKKEDKLGIRSSDTCALLLEDCKVPVENVLKESGKGFPIAMNALDNSRIGIAAQALGIAQGAYESALNYAHQRVAFGKPIAHHQSIGNYLADMATQTEAARHMVYKAAWAKQRHYEEDGPRHSMEASMAKLFAGDTAMWVSERAVQVLGGYGYTTDFPVERFFRDAKITQIYEGTQEVQRIVINRAIAPE